MHNSSKLYTPPDTLERFQLPSHHFVIGVILVAMLSIVGICIAFANFHIRLATDVTQQNINNLLLMEQQFNQHLFVDLDDLMTSLVFDIQQEDGNTAIVLARYEQLLSNYPMLGQIQILDNIGAIIWQSSPEDNLTNSQIQMISQRFLNSDQLNDLWIYPLEADTNDKAIVVLSHAFYGDDGQLQNIAVISVSAEQWGQSFSELTTLDMFSGYWINSDGYILTTFPYQPSLVGTQLTNTQQVMLSSSIAQIIDSSTLLDDRPAAWQSQMMDNAPLQLLIEAPHTETHVFSDNILATTFFISLAAVVSGIATIMLYLSQYRILQAQADTLFHTSQDLQQQITMRTQTETTLADNEERYRLVTELISDYAFSTIVYEDGTRSREWLTDSFFTMTGYQPDDIGEEPQPNVRTHPDDLAQVNADIERSIAGEDTITEYRWRIKSGEYIWMRVKRRPIWDDDHQRVVQLIGAVSDITVEKEAEFALRESEERYRIVTELISDYAFSIQVDPDQNLNILWLTPSYFHLMGYTDDDIDENFSLKTILHLEDKEQPLQDLANVLAGQTVVSEFRAQRKQGDYIWLQITRQPVWDENEGRVVSYYGVARDITAQKEAEIALRASEERYRLVTELMSDYAYLTTINEDGTGVREWLTDSFYQLSDFHSESLGSVPQPEQRTHVDDLAQVEADIQRTTQGEETVSEYRWLASSDKYIWLRVKRRPIWDDDHQNVTHILGAVSDITVEKEAEAALRASEDRYRRISSILTDFAYESYIFPDGSMQQEWTVGGIDNMLLQPNQLTHMSQISRNAHPDDVAKVQADLLLTTNNVETITEYRIKGEGGYRWIRSYRIPVWDEDAGRVVRILGTIKDITAEKDAQKALEENQQRYRELTELMSDFAFSVSLDENDTITANWIVGSLEYITGIDLHTAMADIGVISRLVYADDQHLLREDLQKNRNGEKTITEYRIIHAKTKQIRWLRVNRKPIMNPTTGQLSHALAGVTDITVAKATAIALQESEERYRQISELISDYVFSQKVFDDFSTEVEWKAGSVNIGNISYAEMSQMNRNQLPDNIHPDDYVATMEDIMKTTYGETTISEFRVLNPDDGATNWLRISRQPIWDEDQNRVTRIIGAVSDITVKKSIEAALVESEERYRLVTELISDYVYSLSVMPDKRIKMDWFAGSFEGITGLHINDYIVESPLDMIKGAHPDDYEDAAAKIEQTMAGHSTVSEYRITHSSDKKPRWLRVSRFPTVDKHTGQLIRILGAVTDVTAQKFAEMALRDSEERYRLLTNLMTDYAFSIRFEEDGQLYREWLIGDFEGVLGYSIPTSGYMDQSTIDSFSSKSPEAVNDGIERARRGEASTVDYEIVNRRDNKPRWLRTTRHPIWNKEHTRVIRYLGAVKDITLEKEAEIVRHEAGELRQALEREKSLHALRTRFVSMVTHEFRNPLAAILSSVSLLDKYDHRLTHESRREKFERIYGQVQRLTQLLEDLLEVGELEHHALHYTPQRIDVVDLVNDLYAEYEESIGSQHHLLVNTTHNQVFTYADVHILRQALGNIISNAIKYSPPESEVVCDIILGAENVTIHVIDHGLGIPEAEYNLLFEAFYRATNVSTQPGTGLGLLIAKQSIELHKGTITFESEIGKGTTFTIQFPRVIGKDGDT